MLGSNVIIKSLHPVLTLSNYVEYVHGALSNPRLAVGRLMVINVQLRAPPPTHHRSQFRNNIEANLYSPKIIFH